MNHQRGHRDRHYSLTELTRAAGVSIRTVRYYITEGLLPPPLGAGPRAAYSEGHLDRLRLIGRLKQSYLPLREIRRRLDGLDDEQVRQLLAESPEPPPPPGDRTPDSAAAYVARVLHSAPSSRPAAPSQRVDVHAHPPSSTAESRSRALHGSAFQAEATPPEPPAPPGPILGRAYPAIVPASLAEFDDEPDQEPSGEVEPDAWRRIALGDDAELLIRESAYHRRRDRIDWLIGWARKVFR